MFLPIESVEPPSKQSEEPNARECNVDRPNRLKNIAPLNEDMIHCNSIVFVVIVLLLIVITILLQVISSVARNHRDYSWTRVRFI